MSALFCSLLNYRILIFKWDVAKTILLFSYNRELKLLSYGYPIKLESL
jgi:hypothetical protein